MPEEAIQKTIESYQDKHGNVPFNEWADSLDTRTQKLIFARLDRVEQGNFGDCESVGEGVLELRLHFGPGYRVYLGEIGNIVVLLLGGDKPSQTRDIKKAKKHWKEYKEFTDEQVSKL